MDAKQSLAALKQKYDCLPEDIKEKIDEGLIPLSYEVGVELLKIAKSSKGDLVILATVQQICPFPSGEKTLL